MTPAQFQEELRRKTLRSAYYFYGPERGRIRIALRRLKEACLEEATPEFNQDIFWGDSADPGRVVDALGSLPFGAARRMVVLYQPGDLSRPDARRIARALPSDGAILFCAMDFEEEPEKNPNPILEEIASRGGAVRWDRLAPERLLILLRQKAAARGKRISAAAEEALLAAGGGWLEPCQAILEQAILAAKGEEVSASDLPTFAGSSGPQEEDLSEPIRRRDGPAAVGRLHRLLRRWEPTELAWRIYRAMPTPEVARRLCEWDFRVKSGRAEPAAALEGVVLELCGRGRQTGQA